MRIHIARKSYPGKPLELSYQGWKGRVTVTREISWRSFFRGQRVAVKVQLPWDEDAWSLQSRVNCTTDLLFRGKELVADRQIRGSLRRLFPRTTWEFNDAALGRLSISHGWKRSTIKREDGKVIAVCATVSCWRNKSAMLIRPSYYDWAGALLLVATASWIGAFDSSSRGD